MRRKITLLMLCCALCASCAALPAEERSFAVAVGVALDGEEWAVTARIPNYQEEGGYVTLSARGQSLTEALALLDAAAPMRIHYGQARLLIFSQGMAASPLFPSAWAELAELADMRLQAQVCVTEDDVTAIMDALVPLTGTRLSKSLDTLMETYQHLGVIPDASLSQLMRMGERQCPLVVRVALSGQEEAWPVQGAGDITLAGCFMVDAAGQVRSSLTARETQLLMLMQGRLRKAVITLPEGTVRLSDASGCVRLNGNHAACAMTLHYTDASLEQAALTEAIGVQARRVLGRLADADCDALGLGRQAVRHFSDMAAWHALDWPGLYPSLTWDVQVTLLPPA
ncbi:MAG: hypothetical protein ACI4MJ_01475 [Aristaeellaceae bacterium]